MRRNMVTFLLTDFLLCYCNLSKMCIRDSPYHTGKRFRKKGTSHTGILQCPALTESSRTPVSYTHLTEMSPANREQMTECLESVWNRIQADGGGPMPQKVTKACDSCTFHFIVGQMCIRDRFCCTATMMTVNMVNTIRKYRKIFFL